MKTPKIYPDCMSPDGADPCAGYMELRDRLVDLERVAAAAQSLMKFCEKSVDAGPMTMSPMNEATLVRVLRNSLLLAGYATKAERRP